MITTCVIVSVSFMLGALAQAEAATYKVGVIISTTGKYAKLGQDEKDAMLILQDKINRSGGIKGNKLELLIEDDEGNAAKAGTLVRKLITEEKVVALIGSTGVECSHIMVLECEKRKIPVICFSPSPSIIQGKHWAFNISPDSKTDALATYRAITTILKKTKIGVLYDANEYGTGLKNLMVQIANEKKDVAVVQTESYTMGEADLKPSLIRIRNSGAEVLYLAGTVPTPAIAMRNFRELQMTLSVIGSGGIVNTGFIKLGGQAVEGVYGVARLRYGNPLPEEKELFDAIEAKYKEEPTSFHANGWDAVQILVHAMNTAGNDPKKIRDALEQTRGFKGVIGEYNMSPSDHNGLDPECLSIVQVRNGKWTSVE